MLQIPESKIAVPALPDPFVPRPGLLAALVGDDPADEQVTLVCAPDGYGKTTLLAHWALAAGGPGPGSPGSTSTGATTIRAGSGPASSPP